MQFNPFNFIFSYRMPNLPQQKIGKHFLFPQELIFVLFFQESYNVATSLVPSG